jgi:hypothetical protein
MILELRPVAQLKTPAYPTQDELPVAEITLEETLPLRWQKAKGLAGALALFLAANFSGCGPQAGNQNSQPPSSSPAQVTSPSADSSPSPEFVQANEWVKTIFEKQIFTAGEGGDIILVTPQGKEDGIPGAIQDSQ